MSAFCIPEAFPGHVRRAVPKTPPKFSIQTASASNSHRMIFLADPHPLTPMESYSCKNRGGGGRGHHGTTRSSIFNFQLFNFRPFNHCLFTKRTCAPILYLLYLLHLPYVHVLRVPRAMPLNPNPLIRLPRFPVHTPPMCESLWKTFQFPILERLATHRSFKRPWPQPLFIPLLTTHYSLPDLRVPTVFLLFPLSTFDCQPLRLLRFFTEHGTQRHGSRNKKAFAASAVPLLTSARPERALC